MVAQQIGDGPVSVAGFALGAEGRLVDLQPPSGKAAQRLQQPVEGTILLAFADQAGARDRAGIDHRVEGPIVRTQPDGVEGIAARLDSHDRFDPLGADRLQRQGKHKRLGDRLDREFDSAVADLVHVTIDRRDGDAEVRRVGERELGNVRGDLAALVPGILRMAAREEAGERELSRRNL